MAKSPFWLAVEEGQLINFSDLAHLIALAIHPGEGDSFAYGAARVNLETELQDAVARGELTVRNRLSLGRNTLPLGASLMSSVLLPYDLAPFLEQRGIELRLTPYGSGPEFWTLDNAAVAIAAQEGWTSIARATFLDQLSDAANARTLVVRHPHTDLPVNTGAVRTFYEHTTPNDINHWLESVQAPYRWNLTVTSGAEMDGGDISSKSAPSAHTDALESQAALIAENEALAKRERQICIIELVIESFGLKPMNIPKGKKKLIEQECKRLCKLFGAGPDPFKESWQAALDQKRIRTANHNDYIAG